MSKIRAAIYTCREEIAERVREHLPISEEELGRRMAAYGRHLRYIHRNDDQVPTTESPPED